MKKIRPLLFLLFVTIYTSSLAQISNYSFKLDSSITYNSSLTNEHGAVLPWTYRFEYNQVNNTISHALELGYPENAAILTSGTQYYEGNMVVADTNREADWIVENKFDDYYNAYTYDQADRLISFLKTSSLGEGVDEFEKVDFDYDETGNIYQITEYAYENSNWTEKKRFVYTNTGLHISKIEEYESGAAEPQYTTDYFYNEMGKPYIIHEYYGSTLNYRDTLFYDSEGDLSEKHQWNEFMTGMFRKTEYKKSSFFTNYLYTSRYEQVNDELVEVYSTTYRYSETIMQKDVAQLFEEFEYPDPEKGLFGSEYALVFEQGWEVDGNTSNEDYSAEYFISANEITAIQDLKETTELLYPNPATSSVQVINPNGGLWIIVNEYGQNVMEGTATKIDIEGLQEGVYFLHMNNQVQQFIKQ
jgi:hypothetical protein